MNDMFDYAINETVKLLEALCLIIILLFGGLLVVGTWLAIKAAMEWSDHQALQWEAQAVFDEVRREVSPDPQVDPMLHAVFGQDLDLPEAGAAHSDDWLIRAVFEQV